MFKEAWRKYLQGLNEIYLQNWWGRIWLLIMAASIVFVANCAKYSLDNEYIPYIPFALCLVFWSFIVLIFVRLTNFSWRIRLAVLVGAFAINFIIGIGLLLVHYDEGEHSSAQVKIYNGAETVFSFVKQYSNNEITEEKMRESIENHFSMPRYENIRGKIHILITKDKDCLYEKPFDKGVTEKYYIEKVKEICLLNHVAIVYECAGTPNIFKWWLRTFSFFTMVSENEKIDYIKSGTYKHSLGFLFTYFFLTHCCMFIAYVDRENTSYKQRLERSNEQIEAQREELEAQNEALQEHRINLEERNKKIEAQREELAAKNKKLAEQQEKLERQRDELEAKNEKLQEKNDKLHRFELVYYRMMDDIKKTAKYDPMQSLQVMAFSWRDFIDTQIRSGRHSLRNGMTGRVASEADLKAFEDELYAMVINPTVEKIVSHLNKTVDMIDTAPTEMTTKKIYDEICRHIESKHFKSRAERKHIFVHTDYAADGAYVCNLNLYRLKAIVENLCFNTQQVFFKKRDELEDAGDDTAFDTFDVSVGLTFSIEKRLAGEYLCIDYRDNVTGFPDDLLPKIYRSPVPSAKGGDRKGEGTMYISFFVENMNGSIEAENQIDENGRKCAVTKIFIPTKEEKKELPVRYKWRGSTESR